jgi:SAM-dependent methyltransferase
MSATAAELDYLCVDEFVADIAGARALASAFELGLIDQLATRASCPPAELGRHARLDEQGTALLLGMLRAGRVIEPAPPAGGRMRLTASFTSALRYRALLEAKLDFAALVAPDFLQSFSVLLTEPGRFYGTSRLLELFSYQRCFEATPENLAHTARWMRLTTALTRHEAPVCLSRHDFSGYRRMLDVGGNSGEFALQACRRHAALRATVLDLPLVCELGRRHLLGTPEAPRVNFEVASGEAYPRGHDLVTFKSMLHDWPDAEAQRFLQRAHEALEPGGTLLIFERCRFDPAARPIPYGELPLALFYRSYREPGAYAQPLAALGFRDVEVQTVDLGLPFELVTARK